MSRVALLGLILTIFCGCGSAAPEPSEPGRPRGSAASRVSLVPEGEPLTIKKTALYPETIVFNERSGKFLVGSFREGAVYEVDASGDVSRLVDDPRLCSVLGIAVDAKRGRLWLVNSDLGAGIRPSAAGPKALAAVALYDLTTGKNLGYFEVASLAPGPHLLNGIALDEAGDAYVTDSFAPIIYKVEANGRATVWLSSPEFAGEGINLNGVVVHPGGFLLVVKKSNGALFRVPLSNPAGFTRVKLAEPLIGGDGLVQVGQTGLVVISNEVPGVARNAAISLVSDDEWNTARADGVEELGRVYPTTATLRAGALFLVHSNLNELLAAAPERKAELSAKASIRQIGRVRN